MNPVLTEYQTRAERVLTHSLESLQTPAKLLAAMQYSTLGGGKRVRALLVYATGLALDAPLQRLDAVAAALECMHAYSLIHDDLPAMDDDDLRRGKATNHIAFDEATAILAGDALQTLAFELIAAQESGLSDAQVRAITTCLATAAGRTGMVGGQLLDIEATGKDLELVQLENIHRGKTGAIISAAVQCGAHCSDYATAEKIDYLRRFAEKIGLAFQIIDDVLDVESSTEQLGKQKGADAALGKSTYPALIGLENSRHLAEKLYREAIASIESISDNTGPLMDVAALIVRRQF